MLNQNFSFLRSLILALFFCVVITCPCDAEDSSNVVRSEQSAAMDTAIIDSGRSPQALGGGEMPAGEEDISLPGKGLSDTIKGAIIGAAATVATLLLALYVRRKIREDARKKAIGEEEGKKHFEESERRKLAETDVEKYRELIGADKRLSHISRLDVGGASSNPVKLNDVFVFLQIRNDEKAFGAGEASLAPAEVLRKAFWKKRMLLVLGDPGSGKTTLLKYYLLCCLEGAHSKLGFTAEPLPLYLPLRVFNQRDDFSSDFADVFSAWVKDRYQTDIASAIVQDWLDKKCVLLLLDGLDEISDSEKRGKACVWIDAVLSGLGKNRGACCVVSSRNKAYQELKKAGKSFTTDPVDAGVQDFSHMQQGLFLRKWFIASSLDELSDEQKNDRVQRRLKLKDACVKKNEVLAHLSKEENKGIRELAATPLILQIMAIIWKNSHFLPRTRVELFQTALTFLLEKRDRERNIEVFPAEDAESLLVPVAYDLHLKGKETISKEEMHQYLEPKLKEMTPTCSAEQFCLNMVERAEVIDASGNEYIFHHKLFKEFFVSKQMLRNGFGKDYLSFIISKFPDGDASESDWWQEPIKFWVGQIDDAEVFDRFMQLFFTASVSEKLNASQLLLLQTIILEARRKKTDALTVHLLASETSSERQRSLLRCMKTFAQFDMADALQQDALAAVRHYYDNIYELDKGNNELLSDAQDTINALEKALGGKGGATVFVPSVSMSIETTEKGRQRSFRNKFEYGAEYITINGGSFLYSFTRKKETIPDIMFARYPVTNKQYRTFIDYLKGRGHDFVKLLPVETYDRLVREVDELRKYLSGKDDLVSLFASKYIDERSFNADDQPVSGVTWYAARAYCLWLSMLACAEDGRAPDSDLVRYRLPNDVEREWAAGGRRDEPGKAQEVRLYPWGDEAPTPELANYNRNEGATMPVGSYPDGATPEGLHDMAGNVWEWMNDRSEPHFLRGGSWSSAPEYLACSARFNDFPSFGSNVIGFRVVRPSPSS